MEPNPTPVEHTLAEVMREHPEMCGNRTEALHELLCTENDDYTWEGGAVVRVTALRSESPECDPARWWQKVSTSTAPEPVQAHMARRRARIESVRAAAEELARTPGPAPWAAWVPEPRSLLLTEPEDVNALWRAACDEVWEHIRTAHSRALTTLEAAAEEESTTS